MLLVVDKSGISRLTKQSPLPVGVSADISSVQTLKRALAALRSGPIRFRRNQVIACEGDTADYVFLVVSGVSALAGYSKMASAPSSHFIYPVICLAGTMKRVRSRSRQLAMSW